MITNRWGEEIINERIYYNDILEIELAGITNPNPAYRMMKNINPAQVDYDYYVFEYVLDGIGHIETPEKNYSVFQGDMYFLNKLRYQVYYADIRSPYKKEFIVVRGKLADKLASLYQVNEDVIIRHVDAHPIFEKIFRNLKQEDQIPNDEIENLVFQLFQLLRPTSVSKCNGEKDGADRIKDYLHTHLQEKVTVDKLSKDLYISVSTAQHIFAKKFNCSLMKYFMAIKLDYARMLLRETEYSVAYIAQYLAFDDEKYFSRCFKKVNGVTPKQYRKNHSK